MTDVARIMEVRQAKLALQTLLAKGQIGDDTWAHLLETEKELEAELMEVVGEANHFKQGWGQVIFAHASDMVQHEKQQSIYHSIEAEREKARKLYSLPSPAIRAPPIVGIAAANPKRRTLPANLINAQVPPSKPATPIPPPAAATPAKPVAANPATSSSKSSNTPLKPISPAKVAASASGTATPSRSFVPPMPPASSVKTPSSSPAKTAPLMQRADTAVSTTSSAPTGEGSGSEDGDGDDDEGRGSGVLANATNLVGGNTAGSTNGAAGGKKTPKKTPKKKKGKKK
ncbi:MAG: translocation protein S66 [Cyphobasidiales sp. Tagirdzhanova-0007]|nr:MAG: translocation protein S66 [Cyphobasidiales sp. Tagirdzhanova-0007]